MSTHELAHEVDIARANAIAEALAAEERRRSEPLIRSGDRARRFMDRLRIAVFTLIGVHWGQRLAEAYFGPGMLSLALGLIAGLLLAISVPVPKAWLPDRRH